ncbi:YybH family protein [Zavarzinella formosa]|uniref:YybH family protein n=1 Tax=Zavarzinella formosa TaxID=360055 RepID=UPI0002FF95D6|nr:AtzH-like domain-containing protein [Zavarzinella formosa]
MRSIVAVMMFSLTVASVSQAEEPKREAPAMMPGEKAVRAVLDEQVAAWNNGDIDGFMKGYWKSEKLTFISGGSITQGWEPTRERYVKRYAADGKDKMGKLLFDELHVELLGADAAMVRGVFKLTRSGQTDVGRFTLLFRKFADGWRVVHDHTSVAEKSAPKKSE